MSLFHKFASRRDFLKAGGAITLVGAGLLPARGAPDRSRIALVVGNNSYPRAPLNNAINDAKAVGALLERAGFDVTLKTDVGRDALRQAAKEFGAMARGSEASEVFFYYAGHGAQTNWRNFLIPVDERIETATDLPAQCLEFGGLLNDLSKAKGKVFVLILDACRDNPFGAGFQPAQKGLSQFDAPAGSLLAFSTSPGSVAVDSRTSDRNGVNGLYTGHLVRELSVQGARLEDALKRVRLAVRVASQGLQVPWESTSLESDVFVFPAASSKLTEAELEAEFANEIAVWNRIKASKQPEDWISYLRQYPSGKFNEVAQNRLNYLLRAEEERRALAQSLLVAPAQATPTVASSGEPAARPGPQLEMGPGLPLPLLMRPSPNPASAGTYALNRRYTVGDGAVYAASEPVFGARQPDRRLRVTRVDEDADRVEFNEGRVIRDTLGNSIKRDDESYEPHVQHIPAELQIGRKWTARYRTSKPGSQSEAYLNYRVVSRERVRVPAGEFEAFRLEAEGWHMTTGTRLAVRSWLVPGLNFELKYELIRHPRRGIASNGELFEMISCKQMQWTQV
jgi:uncharacterized caspase-like protein